MAGGLVCARARSPRCSRPPRPAAPRPRCCWLHTREQRHAACSQRVLHPDIRYKKPHSWCKLYGKCVYGSCVVGSALSTESVRERESRSAGLCVPERESGARACVRAFTSAQILGQARGGLRCQCSRAGELEPCGGGSAEPRAGGREEELLAAGHAEVLEGDAPHVRQPRRLPAQHQTLPPRRRPAREPLKFKLAAADSTSIVAGHAACDQDGRHSSWRAAACQSVCDQPDTRLESISAFGFRVSGFGFRVWGLVGKALRTRV
eukprot:3389026-Rhodomonas_salina.1